MVKLKVFLTIAFAYISVVGLVTFSLFIHEEAIQTAMFGTWPAKDINRWDIVMEGADLMASINQSAKIINYSIGWIQPLAFLSYRAYSKSADFYVRSLEAQAFANDPALFEGREVTFKFSPARIEKLETGQWLAVNKKLAVLSNEKFDFNSTEVHGRLIKYKQYLAVVIR